MTLSPSIPAITQCFIQRKQQHAFSTYFLTDQALYCINTTPSAMLTRIHAQCLKQGCVCVLYTVVMNAENGWSWIETGVDDL